MKTKYYLYLIFAASLAACAPESLRPQAEREGLLAVMDADLAATKSILVDNPGEKLESYWQAGDEIGVYGGNAENVLFQLKAEDLSSDRKTAEFQSESAIPSGKLTAYTPYQKEAKKDGDAIVVEFPATQKYVTANGVAAPDPAAHILVGEGTKAGGLSFRPGGRRPEDRPGVREDDAHQEARIPRPVGRGCRRRDEDHAGQHAERRDYRRREGPDPGPGGWPGVS